MLASMLTSVLSSHPVGSDSPLVLGGEGLVGVSLLWLMPRSLRFFFQAEDGIRDLTVTGVQTCALPICDRAGDPVLSGVDVATAAGAAGPGEHPQSCPRSAPARGSHGVGVSAPGRRAG